LTIFLEPDVEVHAIGPEIHVLGARQRAAAPGPVLVLPGSHQPRDRRGAQPGGLRTDQGLQGLGEVAGADALEVQPRDQLLDGLRLPQVRRQDLRAEPRHRLPGGVHILAHHLPRRDLDPLPAHNPPVQHARLLHFDRPEAGDQRPRRMMAVADDLLKAAFVTELGVLFNPGVDFRLNCLSQQALRPVPQNLGQHITSGRWNRGGRVAILVHRRTLLPTVGGSEPSNGPKSTPPFFTQPSTKFGYSSYCGCKQDRPGI
jgi:hypothetical protein